MSDPADSPWQPELDELARRRELAQAMGGAEKVERHRAQGKLTVRERIDALLDPDSFREVGALTGRTTRDDDGTIIAVTPANFVMGRGRIDDRPVVVGGDDFTVRGGAADASIFQKQVMAERMAHDFGLPIVRLVDGSGGGGSVKTLETERRSFVPFNPGWEWVVANLGRVPVVSLCLGSVAGLGAARVVTSHYSVMVKGTSQLFVAGPPVVNRLGIEEVDKETLGGSSIHTRNGAVDDEVETEADAFARARAFLSYLPSSVDELPPRADPTDDPARADDSLLRAIPRERRRVYKVRAIVDAVVDAGSFFEIGAGWGRSAVTGLARLDGWPVAVLANDPYHYAGGWTADASRKVERFVDLAETFRLPVVHLVDNPGFVIGSEGEQQATIRHGARALAAVYQATVPWCSVILRKVYGVAGAAHQNASRLSYRFAWPSGEWGSLPLEGGIEAAYKAQLEAADDPDALRAEIETRLARSRDPFKTAEVFLVEDIVDPRETRARLCEFAEPRGTATRALRPTAEDPAVIPPAVRAAFELRGDGTMLLGGVSGVVRFGDVVVKEVTDTAEAQWEQATFSALAMPADVRWARPVAARDGRFVVDGWIADEFVPGLTPVAPDWDAVIEVGQRFHRATRGVPIPTAMLDARRHRWGRGERHAFDEERVPLTGEIEAIDDELAARCVPDPHPAQVVHVDLTTNVFRGPDGVPVVLDLAPGGRGPGHPSAVVVADALVWHDGDLALVERAHPDPEVSRALVARALRFRLVTDHLAATGSGAAAADPQPYRALLARLS